jgi:type 1 fimbria pilin
MVSTLLSQNFMQSVVERYGKAFSLIVLAMATLKTGAAEASCSLGNAPQNYIIDQTSPVIVDSNAAAGASLGRQGQYTFPNPWRLNCSGQSPVFLKTNLAQDAQTSGDVYELTVGGQRAGVGVRLYMGIDGADFSPMPIERQLTLSSGNPAYSESDTVKAELVRTSSAIVYGKVDAAGVGGSNFYNGIGPVGGPGPYQTVRIGNIVLVRPTCSMDVGSMNQTVNLGRYSVKDLQNPTSTTPWTPFKLVVADCGDPSVLVDITFGTQVDQDSNNPNLFSVQANGPTGFGIALSTDDGANASMVPGATRTFPGKLTGDSYAFRARLERTVAPLTSGEFSKPVTVMVVYR